MPAQITPQQAAAVQAAGTSVVLASGAGCGKTSVLTRRYLKLLAEDGLSVPAIAAVTFTDRAAREMRGRIRDEIERRIAAFTPGSEPFARWARHRTDLETADIGTLHGFAGTLLRTHAEKAGLDPGFETLTEAPATALRAESVRAALNAMLTSESDAGADLRKLVPLFGWCTVVNSLEELLTGPDPAAWASFLALSPEEIATDWSRAKEALLPRWREYVLRWVPAVGPAVMSLRSLAPASPAAAAERDAVLALLEGLPGTVAALVERARVQAKGAKALWGEDYETVRDAFKVLREKVAAKFDGFGQDTGDVVASAEVGRQFVCVAYELNTAYSARKAAVGALDFDDLLVKARDLLRDNADVRDAVRKRYRAVLLDELQDTDPVQAELARLVCGEAGVEHGTLFAVGDAKQSIYRFRGADVAGFSGFRDAVPAAGKLDLTTNFRSQPGILRFVNALCRCWFPSEEPLAPARASTGQPNVEFLWSVPAGGQSDLNAPGARANEAAAIARRIRELLDDPTPRVLEAGVSRRVKAGDIVLLFRSFSNVPIYETALRRAGLDYYLAGGRAFFARQEIYDVLHVLKAVENPLDSLSVVGVMRSPFGNLSDDAVHLIATHRGGAWAGLQDLAVRQLLGPEDRAAAERLAAWLPAWRHAKDRMPAASLLLRVFSDSGFDAATQFDPLADRQLANLWKLVDLAREFDATGLGLAAFVNRLADQVVRQPKEEQAATLPEEADVIRLMTVHAAKGLEFPVVIVPDLNADVGGGFPQAAEWVRGFGCVPRVSREEDEDDPPFSPLPRKWADAKEEIEEHAEELRKFYVAATRAEDLLILSAGFKEWPVENPGQWLFALAAVYDLESGLCRGVGETAVVRVIEPQALAEETAPQHAKPSDAGVLLPDPQPLPAVRSLFLLDAGENDVSPRPVPPGEWPDLRRDLGGEPFAEPPAVKERIADADEVRRDVPFQLLEPGGPLLLGVIDYYVRRGGSWEVLLVRSGPPPLLRLAAAKKATGAAGEWYDPADDRWHA